MTIREVCQYIDVCTAKLRATKARLRLLSLKILMSAEPAILPAWRKRGRTTVQQTVRTTYLRRDYNAADVALLRQIVKIVAHVYVRSGHSTQKSATGESEDQMNDTHFDHKLTMDQLKALLLRAKSDGRNGERNYLMILIGICHGLRNSEICKLTAANFDMEDGTLTVKRGKKSLKTTQPLMRSDDPLLDEYSAVKAYLLDKNGIPKRGRLFDIETGMVRHMFKRYAKDAGIPKALRHPHVLKHTAAHYALDASKRDLVYVQKFLGHKNLSSTGMYLKVSDTEACAAIQPNYFKKS